MNRRDLMIAALGCLTPPVIKATETTVVWKTSAVGRSETMACAFFHWDSPDSEWRKKYGLYKVERT